jgi:hypothetical protein
MLKQEQESDLPPADRFFWSVRQAFDYSGFVITLVL